MDYNLTDECLEELKQEVPGKNTSLSEFVDNLKRKKLEESYAIVIQPRLEKHSGTRKLYSTYNWDKEFIENASKDMASRVVNALKGVFNQDDLVKILKAIVDHSGYIRGDIKQLREADKNGHEKLINLLEGIKAILESNHKNPSDETAEVDATTKMNNTIEFAIDADGKLVKTVTQEDQIKLFKWFTVQEPLYISVKDERIQILKNRNESYIGKLNSGLCCQKRNNFVQIRSYCTTKIGKGEVD